jgi:hypothetical protein
MDIPECGCCVAAGTDFLFAGAFAAGFFATAFFGAAFLAGIGIVMPGMSMCCASAAEGNEPIAIALAATNNLNFTNALQIGRRREMCAASLQVLNGLLRLVILMVVHAVHGVARMHLLHHVLAAAILHSGQVAGL